MCTALRPYTNPFAAGFLSPGEAETLNPLALEVLHLWATEHLQGCTARRNTPSPHQSKRTTPKGSPETNMELDTLTTLFLLDSSLARLQP